MYQPERVTVTVPPADRRFWAWPRRAVPPNVWYLGITSLLTDVSSEMVASVLPMYLVLHLNLSPLAFGALDGLYNGLTAVTRWTGGFVADRWRRYKEVAAAGYVLSALSRLALLGAGRDVSALATVIAADRFGKGIRTAPRDALISLSAPPQHLGYAFGVHRALDATGAMLGPVAAFVLLAFVPNGFDVVFVASAGVAIVGLGVLVCFVNNVVPEGGAGDAAGAPSFRDAVGLLGLRDFRLLVMTASGLALLTVGDAFVYLALRDHLQFAPHLFPLLFVGTAVFYLLLAIPAGRLADRWGRVRTFLLGHVALLLVYALLLSPPGRGLGLLCAVALLGAYYAATDGVALASGTVPGTLRGNGVALLTTATSLSRLVAAVTFGWAWTTLGKDAAIASFSVALAGGIVLAGLAFRRFPLNHG